jgi:hypothetical protein
MKQKDKVLVQREKVLVHEEKPTLAEAVATLREAADDIERRGDQAAVYAVVHVGSLQPGKFPCKKCGEEHEPLGGLREINSHLVVYNAPKVMAMGVYATVLKHLKEDLGLNPMFAFALAGMRGGVEVVKPACMGDAEEKPVAKGKGKTVKVKVS